MTSHLDSHTTTNVKLEMLSGVQKRRHFYVKMTYAKLNIYIGVGARNLYINEAHKALDIFRFAVFLFLFKMSQRILVDLCRAFFINLLSVHLHDDKSEEDHHLLLDLRPVLQLPLVSPHPHQVQLCPGLWHGRIGLD